MFGSAPMENKDRKSKNNWLLFCSYAVLVAAGVYAHELWGDELQAWNLINQTNNFFSLVVHSPQDAHPFLWNTLVRVASLFTDTPEVMQIPSFVMSVLMGFVIIHFSPFNPGTKILILGGYFVLYEFAVFSRGYALSVFLFFLLIKNLSKERPATYFHYLLVFLLSLTHLLAVFLTASTHLFLILKQETNRRRVVHFVAGVLALSPCLLYLLSGHNSGLQFNDVLSMFKGLRLHTVLDVPIRGFFPTPAIWKAEWWNTQMLITAVQDFPFLKYVRYFFSPLLLALAFIPIIHNIKVAVLFTSNLLLTWVFALFFPLESARYTGFVFICWIGCLWLSYNTAPQFSALKVITFLLLVNFISGIWAWQSDLRRPFSRFGDVEDLLSGADPKTLVTDFWGLTFLSAATNKSYYCVESQGLKSYLLLDDSMFYFLRDPQRYTKGIAGFMKRHKTDKVSLFSIYNQNQLINIDTMLPVAYNLELTNKREGAIEKFSNLYIYSITARKVINSDR